MGKKSGNSERPSIKNLDAPIAEEFTILDADAARDFINSAADVEDQ